MDRWTKGEVIPLPHRKGILLGGRFRCFHHPHSSLASLFSALRRRKSAWEEVTVGEAKELLLAWLKSRVLKEGGRGYCRGDDNYYEDGVCPCQADARHPAVWKEPFPFPVFAQSRQRFIVRERLPTRNDWNVDWRFDLQFAN
jgi:hypothetical protein